MAKAIKTRTPTQCRNHHQKYEAKYGNFKKLLEFYKFSMGIENFKNFVYRKRHNIQRKDDCLKVGDG